MFQQFRFFFKLLPMIKKLTVINQAFKKSSVKIVKDVILDKPVKIWKLDTKNI